MTDTDLTKRARRIIKEIAAELDPDRIARLFEDPITMVAREYQLRRMYPITHRDFYRIVADFVRQVYDRALAASWTMTDPLAEALWILEYHYGSPVYGGGYAAAFLDANDPEAGGIQTVVMGLAESIKGIERHNYTQAVFTRHLHRCSWRLRCEIVRALLEDCQAFIPERLAKCVPAQLVDEIPSLVSMSISSDAALRQIVSS